MGKSKNSFMGCVGDTVAQLEKKLNPITYPRYPSGKMKGGARSSCCNTPLNLNSSNRRIMRGGSHPDSGIDTGISGMTILAIIAIIALTICLTVFFIKSRETPAIKVINSKPMINGNKIKKNNMKENMVSVPLETEDGQTIKLDVRIRDDDPDFPNLDLVSYPEYLVDKAQERIVNPILPPERSYEMSYGVPINIPSRGYPSGYQQLGILYKDGIADPSNPIGNNSDTTILPLYGRPLYNGSKKWTYYTTTDKVNIIKLPLSRDGRQCDQDTGCDELYTGDTLKVPPYNGEFKVQIYDWDKPRYIPFAF